MSNPWIFTTRDLGPNAKESALTIAELDNSLLYLSSSIEDSAALSQSIVDINNELLILSQSINEIEFHPLSGSNYIFVEANGTPIQNGNYLTASYDSAKLINPSSSSLFTIILGPGYYEFATDFYIDTPYLNIVSLTGDRDVHITGNSTIIVCTDSAYVKGIDVGIKNFTITGSYFNTVIEKCKGGDESFGGDLTSTQNYQIFNTFIECEGGDWSFAGGGSAEGTFISCVGGDYSFGRNCYGTFKNCIGNDHSFAWQGDIFGGLMEDCTGGINSFASVGSFGLFDLYAKLINCTGVSGSFMNAGVNAVPGSAIYALVQNCRLIGPASWTNQSQVLVPSPNPPIGGGALKNCINGDNTLVNA